ncbi:hypothetical protein [Larkinella soli]|uniref:hypothetical protein n=1 Tax=Larkinella soli TaxID=1770527 RepID=UPI000FFC1D8B|nr:hypothetical protein [Larkinella soli]
MASQYKDFRAVWAELKARKKVTTLDQLRDYLAGCRTPHDFGKALEEGERGIPWGLWPDAIAIIKHYARRQGVRHTRYGFTWKNEPARLVEMGPQHQKAA